jgi:uncharacterized membrane protein
MKESTFVLCMLVIVVIAMIAMLAVGIDFGYRQGQIDALNGKWKVKQVIGVSTNYTTIN